VLRRWQAPPPCTQLQSAVSEPTDERHSTVEKEGRGTGKCSGQLVKAGVVSLWYDECVARVQGVDVQEGHHLLIFHHLAEGLRKRRHYLPMLGGLTGMRGKLPIDNLAENALRIFGMALHFLRCEGLVRPRCDSNRQPCCKLLFLAGNSASCRPIANKIPMPTR
jgi:hypothetical protein